MEITDFRFPFTHINIDDINRCSCLLYQRDQPPRGTLRDHWPLQTPQ